MKRAEFYSKDPGSDRVRCALCPHCCNIAEGATGICRVRQNRKGELYSLSYGRLVSVNLDPVEKKPLYHFHPGAMILSVGSFGCNFTCGFCQNWEISQARPDEAGARDMPALKLLELAKENDSFGIAYTYNEPLMNYEWVRETAAFFAKQGLANVLVTNGYINPGPWEALLPLIDAANIDVKSFDDGFYRRLCGGRVAPVLGAVERMAAKKKHVELTMLLIPGENDSDEGIARFVDWVAGIDPGIPVHFSRYFPQYKMKAPATPIETLEKARRIAGKKLKHVHLGNV